MHITETEFLFSLLRQRFKDVFLNVNEQFQTLKKRPDPVHCLHGFVCYNDGCAGDIWNDLWAAFQAWISADLRQQ